ncbi:solanesyl-diphosphate synthase 1, mitochondrial-like isoform X1 [Phragmites australis]|uniref:solanesyl-diphosphate synthase 1, mitochondrial-like isoform X1 n=3 Tax=Phragmites australis TaxID=29695 RepID=UPI002D7814FC|nr:solanesyl-diphosphate synthase 1, mitochondrial-like isoform X1 [Phragmites australis]
MLARRLLLAGLLLRPVSTASSVPPAAKNMCHWDKFIRSSCYFHSTSDQTSREEGSTAKEVLDPLALIKDEVSEVTDRLRSMVVAEVPELTAAAGYFFRAGAEGKRTCPTVLLLMASAISMDMTDPIVGLENKLRARYMRVAEITEMIHISSLIHDDVLDNADTRRGIDSLNFATGKKLAVLAGDFLLFRAFSAAVSLDNAEVVSLLATAVNNLVTGELMQMSITPAQRCSMDYYLQKTYFKTAALISNSCKAIAVLAGQTTEVQALAYQYGKHLGIAYQLIDDILDFTGTSASLGKASLSDIHQGIVTAPILFAIEEFRQLREIVEQGFDDPSNVDTVLEYLPRSQGIERTRLLAAEHAKLAADAIDSLPESVDRFVLNSRQALKDLTEKFMRRTQ